MSTPVAQAELALRGHNPDVLSCIANLSNDEVFTPPALANQMLDALELAWAVNNSGENLWSNPTVRFLDPFTKSGVFLREIASRLTTGLSIQIPDLDERVDHILTQQVFGIGITTLTSLLARRSVYCSKWATGPHSIAKSFDRDWGNIWFERTEHEWTGGHVGDLLGPDGEPLVVGRRCRFCGAQDVRFERDNSLETHAYAFIHTDDIKARITELFGAEMQFDVVIGNPPYQMTDAAGGGSDASIYHLFVEQAKRLEPRFLSMVIPSRWMAGGRGLDQFRATTLGEHRLRSLVDFPNAKDVFPGVEVKGGVCYFLWDGAYEGACEVTTTRGNETVIAFRDLDEFDVFVRDPRAANILKKVARFGEKSIDSILTNTEPFKYESNFSGYHTIARPGDLPMYLIRSGRRDIGYVSVDAITKNSQLIDTWKVLVVRGYGAGETVPHQILGKPQIAAPPSVCTGSFMFFHVDSKIAAESLQSYFTTRFFRFLVSLRKITQHAFRSTYAWVPTQSWDQTWTDEELYAKYEISGEEIAFIEAQIRPMMLDDSVDE